jgi:hypothetical protein
MKTFEELLQEKQGIEKVVNIYDAELKAFAKKNTDKSGLIGEAMRKSLSYSTAKKNFDIWFKKLQEINVFINRNYKKENREYQKEKRNQLLKN